MKIIIKDIKKLKCKGFVLGFLCWCYKKVINFDTKRLEYLLKYYDKELNKRKQLYNINEKQKQKEISKQLYKVFKQINEHNKMVLKTNELRQK